MPLFTRLRRAFARATKLTRAGNLLAATTVMQKVGMAAAKPARKIMPPRKKSLAAKPRKAEACPPKAALAKPQRSSRRWPAHALRPLSALLHKSRQGFIL